MDKIVPRPMTCSLFAKIITYPNNILHRQMWAILTQFISSTVLSLKNQAFS